MPKSYYSSSFTLGIVGGGQLGKMLLQETRRLDIATKVLDPSSVAPCRIASNTFVQGALTDYQTVYDFGKDCDVVTIEIENINTDALRDLQKEGVTVYPQPSVVELIQSKIRQKDFYSRSALPTAPYLSFNSLADLRKAVDDQRRRFPFVWKIATGGFDGRGVQVVREIADLEKLADGPCIAEDLIPFEKELAVVVARSASGEVKAFPTVEMDFHPTANLVEYVFSPSLIPAALKEQAQKLALSVVEKMELVGILAVEMFVGQDGQLLINEVAPRVHNSGHLSIEGNYTSQFDQHLRAILDLPLGNTDTIYPSVMINLVGDPEHQGPVYYEGIEKVMALPGVYVHLYGKAETRPFRKMGHVTVLAEDLEKARSLAKQVKSSIKVISK